jgi:hypothetical protein
MQLDNFTTAVVGIAVLVAFALGTFSSNIGMRYFYYICACILFGVLVGAEEKPDESETCTICQGRFHRSEGAWVCVKCLVKFGRSSHGKKKGGKSARLVPRRKQA